MLSVRCIEKKKRQDPLWAAGSPIRLHPHKYHLSCLSPRTGMVDVQAINCKLLQNKSTHVGVDIACTKFLCLQICSVHILVATPSPITPFLFEFHLWPYHIASYWCLSCPGFGVRYRIHLCDCCFAMLLILVCIPIRLSSLTWGQGSDMPFGP